MVNHRFPFLTTLGLLAVPCGGQLISRMTDFVSSLVPVNLRQTTDNENYWLSYGVLRGQFPGDRFGWSVALSRDGQTTAIVSEGLDRVDVFEKTGNWTRLYEVSQWDQATGDSGEVVAIMGKDFSGNEKAFLHLDVNEQTDIGYNVRATETLAMSSDGRTVAVQFLKSIIVFRLDPDNDGNWLVLGRSINHGITVFNGTVVEFSADGSSLVVGEPKYDNGRGRVRFYVLSERNPNRENFRTVSWNKTAQDLIGENGELFGTSLSLQVLLPTEERKSTLTYLAIGVPGSNKGTGKVKMVTYNDYSSEFGWVDWGRSSNQDGLIG